MGLEVYTLVQNSKPTFSPGVGLEIYTFVQTAKPTLSWSFIIFDKSNSTFATDLCREMLLVNQVL